MFFFGKSKIKLKEKQEILFLLLIYRNINNLLSKMYKYTQTKNKHTYVQLRVFVAVIYLF